MCCRVVRFMNKIMMKDEVEDAHVACSSKSKADLATETQAFETEFIKTYQCLPELWDPTHSDYTNKYRRATAVDVLLKKMKKWDSSATYLSVRQKINILRSCYRKDLRRHLQSKTIGPNGEEIYEYIPKSWKFHALRFLGGKVDGGESNYLQENSIAEINLDSANFDDEESEEENEAHTRDVLQISAEETRKESQSFKQKFRKKKRRVESESEVPDKDIMFDKELEAISSNVACKLKRMNPSQRCYAELLINKVLIGGLQNTLTDETDLTEIYKYVE